MKPTAKKMNYSLDITRRVPNAELIRDGGTEEKAKALKGTFVKLNPNLFAFIEEAQTTIIEVTEHTRGCACKTFADSNLSLMCEHLIAFDDLKEPPQLMIYNDQKICRVLTEYLFTLGWSVEPDHWLYPSLDSPTHIDAKENDIDDADAKTPLDEKTAQETPSKDDNPKTVHWKCPKCGEEFDVEENKLTDLKLNHMEVCEGNSASKKRAQPAKKKTPTTNDLPKTTKSVDATSGSDEDDPTPSNLPKRPAPTKDLSSCKSDVSNDVARTKQHCTAGLAGRAFGDAGNSQIDELGKNPRILMRAEVKTENDEPTMDEPPSIDGEIAPPNPGSIVNIARAMCEVQKTELFAILNANNPFTRSRYADLSSVWAAIRKPLTDNGLSVIQTTEPYPGGVTVVTTLMHVSGETWVTKLSAKVPEKPRDKNGQEQSNIQSLGSMITYLRRYSLAAMIGVCPADDDGESAMGRGG